MLSVLINFKYTNVIVSAFQGYIKLKCLYLSHSNFGTILSNINFHSENDRNFLHVEILIYQFCSKYVRMRLLLPIVIWFTFFPDTRDSLVVVKGRESYCMNWQWSNGAVVAAGVTRKRSSGDLATKGADETRRSERRQSALVRGHARIERRAAERISQSVWCEPRPHRDTIFFFLSTSRVGVGLLSFLFCLSLESLPLSRSRKKDLFLFLSGLSHSSYLRLSPSLCYLCEFHHSTR